MTAHDWTELGKVFMQFVLGPATVAWVTAKANAKPKRNRNASKKSTR